MWQMNRHLMVAAGIVVAAAAVVGAEGQRRVARGRAVAAQQEVQLGASSAQQAGAEQCLGRLHAVLGPEQPSFQTQRAIGTAVAARSSACRLGELDGAEHLLCHLRKVDSDFVRGSSGT